MILRSLSLATCLVACPAAASDTADSATLSFAPATFDSSTPVCVDPYRYVNAEWLRTTEMPADRPMWGPRSQVVERNRGMQRELAERAAAQVAKGNADTETALVGNFFASGMDQAHIDAAGIAPLQADLARIDGLRTSADVAAFIADSSAQGLDLVFDYYVWARGDDPDRNVVFVDQGGRGLDDHARYRDDDADSKALRAAYLAHLAKLLELSGLPSGQAAQQAKDAFALEQALARASLSFVELRDLDHIFAVRPLAEVVRIAPHLDWPRLLAAHGHATASEISMAQPAFFAELERRLTATPIAHWRAYLRARLLDTMAPHLAKPFAEQHFAFHSKTVRGVPVMPARAKQVIDALNNNNALGMAMSRLFVDAYLPAEAKPRALAMVADLRAAFRARIERLDWMSDATRRAALDKLDRMGGKIGYPDRWPDLRALVLDPDDYAGNVRAAWRFAQQRDDARLGVPVDRSEWRIGLPHEINARYDWQTNEIYFPAPMLLPPAFDPKLDPALNYGALGIIIGHEMTHGFDDQGAQFDAAGRVRSWWTDEDKRNFEARAAKVIERYSQFEIGPGKPVNGALTVGENIADIGGLAIAYDALQRRLQDAPVDAIDGLTQQQRFFLRYASIWRNKIRPEFADLLLKTDPHSPQEFRANAPLAAIPEFAQAFSCKRGDAMAAPAARSIGIW
jgi:putative endopeptidase